MHHTPKTPRPERTGAGHKSDLSDEIEMTPLIPLSPIEVEFEDTVEKTCFEDMQFLRRLCQSPEFQFVRDYEAHLLDELTGFGIPHNVKGPDEKGRLFVQISPCAIIRGIET